MIVERHAAGLNYGVVLIPEGLIEFIPEVGALMHELNEILAHHEANDSNSYEGTPSLSKPKVWSHALRSLAF